MQAWEAFEKSLGGPSDALNPSHVGIMELLYSHQPASLTVAKQFDIQKLWETWIEKDANLAWLLHKLHCNVEKKQQEKKNLLSYRLYTVPFIRDFPCEQSEIKTGNFTYQFRTGAKFLRQKAAQSQFPYHRSNQAHIAINRWILKCEVLYSDKVILRMAATSQCAGQAKPQVPQSHLEEALPNHLLTKHFVKYAATCLEHCCLFFFFDIKVRHCGTAQCDPYQSFR